MTDATFSELDGSGLIVAEGTDATAFLHAQLTSDVAGLAGPTTQYSGYCAPDGRLLATFLVWRLPDRIILQLPHALRVPVQSRLSKFVLRAKVVLADGAAHWKLFGVSGKDAPALVAPFVDGLPAAAHGVAVAGGVAATRLSDGRVLLLAAAPQADAIRAGLRSGARELPESAWMRLDIEAGIPWITPQSQGAYLPQMVNLDLIGAVSYRKGCYPGQEIVARTHYLGRLKQRMYRVLIAGGAAPECGDPLYSGAFGSAQASGAILNAAPRTAGGWEALAVIQTKAAHVGTVHWKTPDGPAVDMQSLPYSIPD
jgi:hypothetical protein